MCPLGNSVVQLSQGKFGYKNAARLGKETDLGSAREARDLMTCGGESDDVCEDSNQNFIT